MRWIAAGFANFSFRKLVQGKVDPTEAAARKKEEEAQALAAKKRARDAERAAKAKAGAAPPSSAALNREAAAGLRESGNEKFRAGDLEAAEQFYKVAIKAAPGDARSRANLAAIALKQGRFAG